MDKLAIIILNYNNYKFTITATENILSISNEIHIIIVDNNSKNESYKILTDKYKNYERIDIIKSETNSGYAKGNNLGIKYIINNYDVDYIGIMNPDVILPDIETIENCIKILQIEKDSAIVAPTMLTNNKLNFGSIAWRISKKFDDLFLIFKNIYRKKIQYTELDIYNYKNKIFYSNVEVLPGSFFIMKKNMLIEIDYLDEETFLYCEERILAKKIKNIGKKSFLIVNNYFYHNHIDNYEKNDFYFNTYINSLIYFNKKYNNKGKMVSKIIKFYKIFYKIKGWLH
ncbi:glycosyltransferase [Fusobacterium hominis]|uniref:glycosyltransferase n=1 Tax=Fusobacterium hominis TaxID=2764326 RepID=UPI0022E2DF70|nr:glycosyltransferase family 2 protein [Fusobacterium hominis]